jgi:1-acyl-sn-glycerol-3-phosphate acyltransferase
MTSALFRPTSHCGSACLSPAADHAHQVRQVVRVAAAATVLATATAVGPIVGALPGSVRARAARVLLRHIARTLLRVLGIRVTHGGPTLPTSRALIVANHISWLDIIALVASADLRIVAKTEVATWPVIGRLARLSGAIFIDREHPRTLPATIAEIRNALAAGQVVAVFAEGTTSCGDHTVPYRPAVFQAAIDAGARVVPLALRYRLTDGTPTPRPAFIGDETLMTSLRRVLAMRSVRLEMRAGSGLHPQTGASRRTLARITAAAMPVDDADPDQPMTVPFPRFETTPTGLPLAA